MVDFKQGGFLKLRAIDPQQGLGFVAPLLVEGEAVVGAFQAGRDSLVFTTKRIVAINVQGITGKKTDYTSIPYSKIQTFSVETSGVFDRDSELEIYVSPIGMIKFELQGSFDIRALAKIIGGYVL